MYSFCDQINLYVKGRISLEDAKRQERTAREILKRLEHQPGLILADEVGMGKTFVALAVAVSVRLSDPQKRPVVVMVPPSLKEKWPSDFMTFLAYCLPVSLAKKLSFGRATNAVEFLKLLDDPIRRRKSIIFMTHGAMSRGLNDGWVKLGLIYRALYRRHNVNKLIKALCRNMGALLHMKWVQKRCPDVWERLIKNNPRYWLRILKRSGIDPEHDDSPDTDDDPVPEAILSILDELKLDNVFETLRQIPRRRSVYYERNLAIARNYINETLKDVWKKCIKKIRYRLPLLILDEAHHLKNAQTRLASLFHLDEAREDAEEISRGPLGGVFERMLFLTATPFQLGHNELCSVLERFSGICWASKSSPSGGRQHFEEQLGSLRLALDKAQEAAITLDTAWGRLLPNDIVNNGQKCEDIEQWWSSLSHGKNMLPTVSEVWNCYHRALKAMKEAEKQLQPWVIRHLKTTHLPAPYTIVPRRQKFSGRTIFSEKRDEDGLGLLVSDNALLPFLLAARACAHNPESRPVFAEGLASSYEAFLHTRQSITESTDIDDDPIEDKPVSQISKWHLDKLEELIPKGDAKASASHPKIHATMFRVVQLWKKGEKVVVFCHYIQTGKALQQRISEEIYRLILELGAKKLNCRVSEVPEYLTRLGRRFFDEDSPARRACDAAVSDILRDKQYQLLREESPAILELVRRYLRTPSFLVRYFPLEGRRITEESVEIAMNTKDKSGLTLRQILEQFFKFLIEKCDEEKRRRYIEAVKRIQAGFRYATDVSSPFTNGETQDELTESIVPNVRLVNGATKSETRQRLMLTFNTPFYPEILVTSSVMAEGVDLHLNCRYVIHHDLCWNPSTLEQRIGRLDRLGCKAENCGQPIYVYLPFIAETQDEKMFRVVMDRERWFKVVMGEQYSTTAEATEKISNRVPFPLKAAEDLAFRLEVR